MRAAAHQPHYFPWVGYFDKMAKSDQFILMDTVQLEKRSPMTRNRMLAPDGELRYISISANQSGHREKEYREIPLSKDTDWRGKNLSILQAYYRKAPFYQEVMKLLESYFARDFQTLCECTIASVYLVKELLRIPTRPVLQSQLTYDRGQRKSDLILELCLASGANIYVSGRGASMNYLDREKFAENGVKIVFQDFQHPVYPQCNAKEFVPGISVLDMLFNCGIEESRRIFWENVNSTHEFEGSKE